MSRVDNFTHIDLCSGIGTFVESAQRFIDNYKLLALCEVDTYCQQQLRYNFPDIPIEPNVLTLDATKYADATLLTAGFPCNDISIGNNNNPKGIYGEKSSLWFNIYEIITHILPRYILLENSDRLVQRGLTVIAEQLARIGYVVQWRTLRAEQFGYPHRRKRLFITAFLNSYGIGFDTLQFFNREFEKVLRKTETETKQKLEGLFGGLHSVEVFRSNYTKFQQMDNGYTHKENAAELHAIGNAIVPELIDVHTITLNTLHKLL